MTLSSLIPILVGGSWGRRSRDRRNDGPLHEPLPASVHANRGHLCGQPCVSCVSCKPSSGLQRNRKTAGRGSHRFEQNFTSNERTADRATGTPSDDWFTICRNFPLCSGGGKPVRQFPSWLFHAIGPASLVNVGQATSSSQQRAKHAQYYQSRTSQPTPGYQKSDWVGYESLVLAAVCWPL